MWTTGLLLGVLFLTPAGPARAGLRVFTCEPVWAELARALGGPDLHVDSATTPFQDVHYIQARPSLISKLRRADLLVCSGADLEVGWLPVLLQQASNARVQPGSPGYLEAARVVPMLDVPTAVDRAQGDVHPYGNPHVQMDPHNLARVAEVLAERLATLDPENAAGHRARHAAFARRWSEATTRWEARAAPLRGTEIVVHHKAWVYLTHWLGLRVAGRLEPKPGIPPSAAHLSMLLEQLGERPARAIVRAAYQDARPSQWLSERTGIPELVLPHTVGATDAATDLFSLFDEIVERLLEVRS